MMIAALGVALSACAQGSAGGLWVLAGLLLIAPLSFRAAHAGPPIPCRGTESRSCVEGRIQTQCCPLGSACNFENRPFQDCGAGLCTDKDRGHCPDPVAKLDPPESCGDRWELACVEGQVARACIPMVPTNYGGPPLNPAFKTCGVWPTRQTQVGIPCTTNALQERCYPVKDGEPQGARKVRAIRADQCGVVPWGGYTGVTARWTEVCLDGQVSQRCLPTRPETGRFEATSFSVDKKTGACVLRAP
jgi:hypothetical protein